ncbi:bifunctional folylpolyglutamate synthase/dihydrofolate synthase [Cellulomonas sp. zg-ZUI199]|uniref:tetrahydrofolate synthase n=1 Tax=Cellulomonas wangleii TaxID=2816956 RepID=A0ABX8D893_9CELL|nr:MULTISPECIES: folylpolyglutamate synthase/dihydrofolate synthase family protein [Cellulomonas]MBO0900751.1 bifunctional folylpolyglutamate synthase/dihydrofolate synthase [Cellulomonas sp. zg-ZUI22]MBO0925835.1 bifunctional folylpolyglutamate synthase/dihydrofolate synthase [Cellulomonas wangleii]QVI63649.1 bifunctional folylpolyglutamate synthase/dihydrofolate synthase [Cellulomonas wangleii]
MSRERGGADHLRDEAARAARKAADQVYRAILARAPEQDIDPTLDRVRDVLELLGDPQRAFRCVHVTGTNGKTSTARMVERLLREHGLRTGRFTSPHMTRVTERISIDGEPISDERFVEVWNDVAPYIEMVDERHLAQGGQRLSFFEVFTVMAYAAFADAPVDVAVVEVGMGGRWDATNLVDAEVAVITPIAMDHERYLGHTLVEIASEKSGIVKDGATVVLAHQTDDVEGVVLAAAAERGARVVREDVDIAVVERQVAVGGQLVALRGLGGVYTDVFLPLYGEHQAHNALLALAATESLLTGGRALDGAVVEVAFADVTSPGRLEVVRSSPTVLVDGAHNPAGAEALVDAVEEAFEFTRLVGVVGVMADKDPEGILAALEPLLAEVVVTQASNPRAMDADDLAEVAVDVFGEDRVHVAARLPDAIDVAVQRAEGEAERGAGVLVTGSILLVAEARILLGRP